jgi:glycosyltransferase involved in cell wall biosynthesis
LKKIAWFIPYPTEGSGGHRTIFQNIQALVNRGYECHAYIEDIGAGDTPGNMKQTIDKYFGTIDTIVHMGFQPKEQYDLIFATAWYTAKFVRDVDQNCKKAYFIQDFEAYFNPMGDGYLLADNSYRYGLMPVTIGKWLSNKMINEFNTPSNYFEFCADNKVYRKLNTPKEKAICFIYQPEKPRRCNVIGIEALGIVKHLMPDVKIYLYGSKQKTNVWFDHINLELINIEQCNQLYNKCMAGLCISSSNPSRIPFEMMASGLPVVDIYKENNLYDLPDNGVLLADQTPESLAEALINIITNREKQQEMSSHGVKFMEDKGLDSGFKQFVSAVDKMFEENYTGTTTIQKMYQIPPVVANVFLQNKSRDIAPQSVHPISDIRRGLLYRGLRKIKRSVKRFIKN